MKRPSILTAEHVRRALLAYVADARAASRALGSIYPDPADAQLWEAASDAGHCARLAAIANDVDALGCVWAQPPAEHDSVERAAFELLLRLPRWAGASRSEDAAVMKGIEEPAVVRAFLPRAWAAVRALLAARKKAARTASRG